MTLEINHDVSGSRLTNDAGSPDAADALMSVTGGISRVPAQEILAKVRGDRQVIQNFCPLADSIEWRLGQRYWKERGTKAFLSDSIPVPYIVNNDGTLSRNAAEVLFASLLAAETAGSLPPQVFTLELGIGVGLFARYFLDAFRDLCSRHKKDYYSRLCYIAGDCSEPMLRDACRNGVFANHPGRYLLRIVDACQPGQYLKRELLLSRSFPRPLWAVFLNYVLDCLPTGVLEIAREAVRQLCVRTCLARGVNLGEFTSLTPEQLARCVTSSDPDTQRELLKVFGLFASEYEYRPVDVRQIPYGEFAVEFARPRSKRVVLNYGAMQCLEALLSLVQEEGFVLINDYGQTAVPRTEEYEHQRFSQATSIGLFFPLLHAYFAEGKRCRWVQPYQEDGAIYARLLAHRPADETVTRFHECFSKPALDQMREPAEKARQLAKAGRLDAAAASYGEALERQPYNWMLVNEIAGFLTFSLRDLRAGIDMARVGLALNPNSHELWNTLGEGLFEFGRLAEARQAYLKALQINSQDVRARCNLGWVHEREHDYSAALARIAEALALDGAGYYRERLLGKQTEILARVSQRHYQETLRHANRISTAPTRSEPEQQAARPVSNAPKSGLPPPEAQPRSSLS